MRILGIETSCDETAISIIDVDEAANSVRVLANIVHTQMDLHTPYGGVFPMLAKREHAKNLVPVLKQALDAAAMHTPGTTSIDLAQTEEILKLEPELFTAFKAFVPTIAKPNIDLISVTAGPGLEPALWVGIGFARALSLAWNVPVVPANHMEGHVLAALIAPISEGAYDLLNRRILYPALSLLISGGHTQIVVTDAVGSYRIAGDTRDDAVGECFDKVARTLGLAYPGGPKVSKLAAEARAEGIESPEPLPRPMIDSPDLDFSFSGLKTAVLYLTKRVTLDERTIKGICREAEDAVTDVLVAKVRKAIEIYAVETMIVGGGVIANPHIRQALERLAVDSTVKLLLPHTDHSTDNALMMALAGYFNTDKALQPGADIVAKGTLPIGPRA
ncbi:MAG: tRNA (adenosine(37)-N6)-threonylcarbamoyltransferase complex transferase subunit TsaD [bacterium]|nr:tRNA (adenosine(37)-N6)-threonylcarbamoyltransferase complex transferase subunit TsaD [bacterium]